MSFFTKEIEDVHEEHYFVCLFDVASSRNSKRYAIHFVFIGTCIDQVNSYICQCDAGYTGYECNVEIDECQSSPCVRGG